MKQDGLVFDVVTESTSVCLVWTKAFTGQTFYLGLPPKTNTPSVSQRIICNDNVPNLQTRWCFKRSSDPAPVHSAGVQGLSFPTCITCLRPSTSSCSGDRGMTDAALPWLGLESTVWAQVVGAGPRQVDSSLGALDAACLCGPSVTSAGTGQGPGWTGIRALHPGWAPPLPWPPTQGDSEQRAAHSHVLGAAESRGSLPRSWPESGSRVSSPRRFLYTVLAADLPSIAPTSLPPPPAGLVPPGAPRRLLWVGALSQAPPARPPRRSPGRPGGSPAYPCCRPRRRLCCSTSW